MDSPTPEPPRASSRKRTATSLAASDSHLDTAVPEHGDDAHGPAKKKRAPRSTAAEKQAKKVARMERNRLAAQVSRDKKRQEAELLAKRVAELEAQLVVDSPASSASPSFALPPTPASFTAALPAATTTTTTRDALVERLQDENESLKTQLALEQLQSQSLQIRLSSLEAKFGRLEQLLSHANTGGQQVQHERREGGALDSTAPAAEVGSTETDSSRLVAREDDISLPRKLSHPSFLPLPPPPSTSRATTTSTSASSSTSMHSSASTLAPQPSTARPSLHQLLSAITVPSTTCPTTSSRRRGSTGRAGSTSAPSRRPTRASPPRRHRRSSKSASLTCSSSCAKTRLVRLKLSVRR
ncbi:uncharacterized protein RHOBADRAFT_50692 [Rhodotorula graminis WP1]|uniref:BZIP domain-containing protein n=1 Tax=Rhodotorula graminis (strain WP1) TaxID=578459 RepID=A0A194SBT3_RHOGW|nr:uncharacterized protein RHOBADRAFT_50692 [Rhodotorula graminis WP1]KPV78193.1 hypothetical protein RHOBADRAFT_50692 [Rhodotorula graminis WP1]